MTTTVSIKTRAHPAEVKVGDQTVTVQPHQQQQFHIEPSDELSVKQVEPSSDTTSTSQDSTDEKPSAEQPEKNGDAEVDNNTRPMGSKPRGK